ncbi:peptide chain release factor H [Burkholderiaceae bacterium DAT-1]|nr:peptide chain release factor H [Burkholderiaceae bacterium DAT-1]
MRLLQISAAQGPAECCLAVVKAAARLMAEARAMNVRVAEIEQLAGPERGTLRSLLLSLEGEQAAALAASWVGTVQWTCPSPFRPRHPRKNWFIGITQWAVASESSDDAQIADIRFEATRASGPGGQHVNKTSSAIRATHVASGISVRVESERSQHANKRLAIALIHLKLSERAADIQAQQRSDRRLEHHQLERGNAARMFKGPDFTPA